MNRKHIHKIISFAALSLFFALTVNITSFAKNISVNVPNATEFSEEVPSERSDDIRWRYKSENGKLYMRLFNYSTNEWIGDWILVP